MTMPEFADHVGSTGEISNAEFAARFGKNNEDYDHKPPSSKWLCY